MALEGIIPPIVTPKKANGDPDLKSLSKLMTFMNQSGVHGVFGLGNCGQFQDFNISQKRDVIDTIVRRAEMDVYVGVTGDSIEESAELAEYAAENGADAVVFIAGYGKFTSNPRKECLKNVNKFLELTDHNMKVVLYNNYWLTKQQNIPSKIFAELKKTKRVIGVKESSGNLGYFDLVIRNRNMPILQGDEYNIAHALEKGAAGAVPSIANLEPHLSLGIFYNQHDPERMKDYQRKQNEVSEEVYEGKRTADNVIRNIKERLKEKGIIRTAH